MSQPIEVELKQRIEVIEETYEFMLAYAALLWPNGKIDVGHDQRSSR